MIDALFCEHGIAFSYRGRHKRPIAATERPDPQANGLFLPAAATCSYKREMLADDAPAPPASKKSRTLAIVSLLFSLAFPLVGLLALALVPTRGWQGLGYLIIWALCSGSSIAIGLVLAIIAVVSKPRSAAAPFTLVISLLALGGLASVFWG